VQSSSSVSGKVVLVTGASSGIGRATALLLDGLGASLVLVGRNPDQLAATAQQLKNPHLLFALDVSDLSALNRAVESVKNTSSSSKRSSTV
jgi:NADP-dependent 3-hydroxy acid dehydrogenase YdfG